MVLHVPVRRQDEQLAAVFGADRVLGATATLSGEVLSDGVVRFTLNQRFAIGELPSGTSARVEARVIPSPARKEVPELASAWNFKEVRSRKLLESEAARRAPTSTPLTQSTPDIEDEERRGQWSASLAQPTSRARPVASARSSAGRSASGSTDQVYVSISMWSVTARSPASSARRVSRSTGRVLASGGSGSSCRGTW